MSAKLAKVARRYLNKILSPQKLFLIYSHRSIILIWRAVSRFLCVENPWLGMNNHSQPTSSDAFKIYKSLAVYSTTLKIF
jgi:hypothetical protein